MKSLKDMTIDELYEKHMDLMLEITYETCSIKEHEKNVNNATAEIQLIDDELEKRENPNIKLV